MEIRLISKGDIFGCFSSSDTCILLFMGFYFLSQLIVGEHVVVNYNTDNPKERGFWYDAEVVRQVNGCLLWNLPLCVVLCFFSSSCCPFSSPPLFLFVCRSFLLF